MLVSDGCDFGAKSLKILQDDGLTDDEIQRFIEFLEEVEREDAYDPSPALLLIDPKRRGAMRPDSRFVHRSIAQAYRYVRPDDFDFLDAEMLD